MNIAFERVEYTISNSISTSSNVCIQLTNGTLERNVTVTIGAKFGGITSGMLIICIGAEKYLQLQIHITNLFQG